MPVTHAQAAHDRKSEKTPEEKQVFYQSQPE